MPLVALRNGCNDFYSCTTTMLKALICYRFDYRNGLASAGHLEPEIVQLQNVHRLHLRSKMAAMFCGINGAMKRNLAHVVTCIMVIVASLFNITFFFHIVRSNVTSGFRSVTHCATCQKRSS